MSHPGDSRLARHHEAGRGASIRKSGSAGLAIPAGVHQVRRKGHAADGAAARIHRPPCLAASCLQHFDVQHAVQCSAAQSQGVSADAVGAAVLPLRLP
jgi:hypothetical protein